MYVKVRVCSQAEFKRRDLIPHAEMDFGPVT